jgi:hypothetical protein
MGRTKVNIKAVDEHRRAVARSLGLATGAAATLAAAAFMFAAQPARSAELVPANTSEKASLDQTAKIYTVSEAAELSKAPQKQIVFHYDVSMPVMYTDAIKAQAHGLRAQGYYAIAIPGGPAQGAQVYVAGLTSPKLFFNAEQIWNRQPKDYAAAYYKKLIGEPLGTPIETAALGL